MRLDRLDEIARRQNGVVRFGQTGLSRSAWHRAIDAGSLVALHPLVARCVGTEVTELQRIRAATLTVDSSVASHRSAAMLWELVPPDADAEVHLTDTGGAARRPTLEQVTCHRPRDRIDLRSVTRHGIPATPPLRTLVDLGITDAALVHGAVGAALGSGLVTIDGVDDCVRRHSMHGRTGVVALRSALDDWAIDARPADSILESAFVELCERHRLPAVTFHEVIEGWEVDFRFVGTPIIVECDGWTTHGRRRHQFETDRRKDDDLRSAGWVPTRFTYRSITQRSTDTARRLRRLLDRWGDHPVPGHPRRARNAA
ncbi:MAG: DUF559 domain-containing protein [Actinomycetota bacterium]